MIKHDYNPDVLETLANLSSDEVFTPPKVVNQVLDMLPQKIFKNKKTKFLDPAAKSGVFLREIVKRLDIGLEQQMPDKQERINHILTRQIFGIAITELTSIISRRTLYCSKKANGDYSICTKFLNEHGNIYYEHIQHFWHNKKCKYCGTNKDQFDRDSSFETYAYQFIHNEIPKELENMNFDVIIGNPPYQMSDGGAQASAVPIYNKFIEQAIKLNPRFLTMIVPSRWFSGGRGLEKFRKSMLDDNRLRKIIDYPQSKDCFPGVEIKGGVNYFLWDRDNPGDCEVTRIEGDEIKSKMERPLIEKGLDIFIRYNEAIPIYRKIMSFNENTFDSIVSSQKPFGLRTYVKGTKIEGKNDIKLYGNKEITFIDRNEIKVNSGWISNWKILISMAYGAGEGFPHQIINKPIIAPPGSACTETYIVIGPFDSQEISLNVKSYIQTHFFRFLVMLMKITQHASKKVYSLVPIQDFSKKWNDEMLYKKYDLNITEINFVNSMIKEMDGHGVN